MSFLVLNPLVHAQQDARDDPGGARPMHDMLPEEGGFADYTAMLDDEPAVSTPGGVLTPAPGARGTPHLASGELPWARASQKIHSPLLRLHNGE